MHDVLKYYNNRRIFITGHTGFKGAWMCKVLEMLGAKVSGYALEPPTSPNLFNIAQIGKYISSSIGDIRDFEALNKKILEFQPEIVIHMAAQPLVRESYMNPVKTYEINVMGTVNILESIRHCESVKSVVNVTTDKVYHNNEWNWGYREDDRLDGYDPYSNSKSCSELITSSYKRSFFNENRISLSTCRAGNVIGGGDFAMDRIMPDCIRAVQNNENIIVRNPYSIRPYQHVLEPVFAYLLVAANQYENKEYEDNYNVGPDDCDCVSTSDLVTIFCKHFSDINWIDKSELNAPHEANFLKLDCSKIKNKLMWKPKWHIKQAVDAAVLWYKAYMQNEDINSIMEKQIEQYLR